MISKHEEVTIFTSSCFFPKKSILTPKIKLIMFKTLLTGCTLIVASALFAQSTSTLSTVSNLLPSTKIIDVTANGSDIYEKTDIDPSGDYTLEVKSTVTSSANRGLDAEVRDASGQGFRVSCSPTAILDFANIFSAGTSIITNDNTAATTMRYVMYNNALNIYKNNAVTPINAAPIAKTSVSRNILDNGGFEEGVLNAIPAYWTKYSVGGGMTGVATANYDANTIISPRTGSRFAKVSVTSAGTLAFKCPVSVVEKTIYNLSFYYHNSSASSTNNVNIYVRLYNGSTIVAGTTLNSNGSAGWKYGSFPLLVPAGVSSLDLTFYNTTNKSVIYFDDIELRNVGADMQQATENSSVNATGIYSAANIFSSLNPGFESNVADEAPANWLSSITLGGAGNARVIDSGSQISSLEGTKSFYFPFSGAVTYYALPIPIGKLIAGKQYVLKFDYCYHGTALAANVYPKFNVAINSNADNTGTGVGVVLSSLALNSANGVSPYTAKSDFPIVFQAPATVDAATQYYLVFLKNTAHDFQIDKLTMTEVPSISGLIVGKNFFNGAANMEITSIKYTTGAYIPGDTPSKLEENVSDQFIGYANGQLILRNVNAHELSIFDVTGKKVISSSLQSATTSLSVQLSKGVYVVKAGAMSQKLIVK